MHCLVLNEPWLAMQTNYYNSWPWCIMAPMCYDIMALVCCIRIQTDFNIVIQTMHFIALKQKSFEQKSVMCNVFGVSPCF